MPYKETKGLCQSCTMSIRCETWAEWKCKVSERRYFKGVTICDAYEKRGRNFKESKCQCEDCLKNEFLERQEEK